MKKAKILLTAIGIFAIVGGALAFKANRGAVVFCSTGMGVAGRCDIPVVDATLTTAGQAIKGYCTTHSNLACPVIRNLYHLP